MTEDEAALRALSPHVSFAEFLYGINISPSRRYMYVETPKVGCTTLKSLLIRSELGQNIEFADPDDVHRRTLSPLLNPRQVGNFLELIKSSIFRFCFVRDPYSRLLSIYLDKIAQPDWRRDNIAAALGVDPAVHQITFAEFVNAIMQQSVTETDSHWRIQYYQTFQDTLTYDFVGRFENFMDDLRFVCGKIGVDLDRWYRSETLHATNAASRLDEFYNRNLKDLVYSKYRLDFDYFGYSP